VPITPDSARILKHSRRRPSWVAAEHGTLLVATQQVGPLPTASVTPDSAARGTLPPNFANPPRVRAIAHLGSRPDMWDPQGRPATGRTLTDGSVTPDSAATTSHAFQTPWRTPQSTGCRPTRATTIARLNGRYSQWTRLALQLISV
jgi:hypothetical protein